MSGNFSKLRIMRTVTSNIEITVQSIKTRYTAQEIQKEVRMDKLEED